ncbi:MAG: hypothetical protein GDA67_04660 [Nitrospira sp. CR1.3]|nr:hypothetical protein [Nitrospira sp. CR1.3]
MLLFFRNQRYQAQVTATSSTRRVSGQASRQSIPVFRTQGTALQPAISNRLPAIQTISPADKAALLKQALNYTGAGQPYALLTPGNPVSANKGSLVFVASEVIDSSIKLARYPGSLNGTGRQMLWIRADANRQYLVDNTVGTYYVPSNFRIEGPGVAQTVYSAFANDMANKQLNGIASDHVQFVLQALSTAWYGFAIWNTSVTWFFFSCEVTQL